LQGIRAEREPSQRHEGQVAADQALLDGAEHRLVGLDVDVHVLELSDLHPVAVNQRLAVPFGDVLAIGHCCASLRRTLPRRYAASLAPWHARYGGGL
jgi:hypothetical protein